MQPTPGGSSTSTTGSGGGSSRELNRPLSGGGVLARFQSAPASWLEALLEDDEEDPLKPNQCLTQLLATNSPNPPPPPPPLSGQLFESAGLSRLNSSPPHFGDGYFSNYGISSMDAYLPSGMEVSPSSKRTRDVDAQYPPPKFAPLKQEPGVQAPSGVSSLVDMDMDKLLEDAVPCRVRAKRGCATHPRSIAERVRRTRISDRIRKLQELVPNMDKQTNTADMLDEAVEYVKYLQRQIQELSEQQRKCTCIPKE